MQPTLPPIASAPLGRTERPAATPLSQLVAKVLNAPQPAPAPAVDPQPAATKDQPPARADGRNVRPGSFVDIRV